MLFFKEAGRNELLSFTATFDDLDRIEFDFRKIEVLQPTGLSVSYQIFMPSIIACITGTNIRISALRGSPPFLHKPILHTLDPTQPIQHTIVPSRAYYATSVVLREAVMYDTGNRSNTRRYCTAPNSPQTDFTRPRFNTTRF